MSPATPVEVIIGGHKLIVSSEHSPEYTREVAAFFDQAIHRIRAELPTVDAHRAAILAGLSVTDQLFQLERSGEAAMKRVSAVAERLERQSRG
jgi:cell division protein ZapA (FtsZ GTPase activity inhibitor)